MFLRTFVRLLTHTQLLPILESGEETLVGGQAVMEGVMMRAPHSYCVAVRKPSGEIVTEQMPLPRLSEQHKIFKLPIIRGVGTLYQAMKLGFKALNFSAAAALDNPSIPAEKRPSEKVWNGAVIANLVIGLAMFIVLYKAIPLLLVTKLEKVYPVISGRFAEATVDGLIRMAIFLMFLYGMSKMKDIFRVFQYHGAEHKVVFNYESGQAVNIENAQKFVTWHPRCGTSFLFVLLILVIPFYALIPFQGYAAKLISRLVILPFVVGLSYELIRFAAKRRGSFLATITAPGLWLQRITTKAPDDTQAEVAIRALEGAMELEKAQGGQLVIA
ncbi:MAG TPA: DUF1385 domain-containing protein [Bryobacteraceae bacterium]|nr:DUF1385 domain-containing protein [Bryobacteraceae bacterium]